MLRGVNKRMIVIKDTGSELFEEVYFVLRPQRPNAHRAQGMDIVKAANQLLFEFDRSARERDGGACGQRSEPRQTKFFGGAGEMGSILYDGEFLNRRRPAEPAAEEREPAGGDLPFGMKIGRLLVKLRAAVYFLAGLSLMSVIALLYYFLDRAMR